MKRILLASVALISAVMMVSAQQQPRQPRQEPQGNQRPVANSSPTASQNPPTIQIQGDQVIVQGQGGAPQTFPLGTIGQTVQVNGQSFVLSFGRGADGQPALIVTPSPGSSGVSLNIQTGNRVTQVALQPNSTATMRMQNGVLTTVSAGLAGGVSVNGQPVNPGASFAVNGSNTPANQPATGQNQQNNNDQVPALELDDIRQQHTDFFNTQNSGINDSAMFPVSQATASPTPAPSASPVNPVTSPTPNPPAS